MTFVLDRFFRSFRATPRFSTGTQGSAALHPGLSSDAPFGARRAKVIFELCASAKQERPRHSGATAGFCCPGNAWPANP